MPSSFVGSPINEKLGSSRLAQCRNRRFVSVIVACFSPYLTEGNGLGGCLKEYKQEYAMVRHECKRCCLSIEAASHHREGMLSKKTSIDNRMHPSLVQHTTLSRKHQLNFGWCLKKETTSLCSLFRFHGCRLCCGSFTGHKKMEVIGSASSFPYMKCDGKDTLVRWLPPCFTIV